MKDVRLHLRIMSLVLIVFMVNKFMLRPFVLKHESLGFLEVFVLSVPNFLEAIFGVLMLTNLALVVNVRYWSGKYKESNLYMLTLTFAALFVVTQELKIHNLGGRNVYDPMDLIFSVVGIVVVGVFLALKQPRVTNDGSWE